MLIRSPNPTGLRSEQCLELLKRNGLGSEAAMTMTRTLSARAKRRLEMAAALLHRRLLAPEALRDDFYDQVLRIIDRLSVERREHLRALVDRVESYEAAAQSHRNRAMNPQRQSFVHQVHHDRQGDSR